MSGPSPKNMPSPATTLRLSDSDGLLEASKTSKSYHCNHGLRGRGMNKKVGEGPYS
jgi:hypothetical protein